MNQPQSSNTTGSWLAVGIGIGVAVGASFGPVGMGVGVALGTVIALALSAYGRKPGDELK